MSIHAGQLRGQRPAGVHPAGDRFHTHPGPALLGYRVGPGRVDDAEQLTGTVGDTQRATGGILVRGVHAQGLGQRRADRYHPQVAGQTAGADPRRVPDQPAPLDRLRGAGPQRHRDQSGDHDARLGEPALRYPPTPAARVSTATARPAHPATSSPRSRRPVAAHTAARSARPPSSGSPGSDVVDRHHDVAQRQLEGQLVRAASRPAAGSAAPELARPEQPATPPGRPAPPRPRCADRAPPRPARCGRRAGRG